MKNYKIDFAANTVTVTKDFMKKAEQLGTLEFNTMMELRKLRMMITINTNLHLKSNFQSIV